MSAATELPPGPRIPATAQAIRWAMTPGPFLEACQQRYGEVFTLRLVPGRRIGTVFISDPEAAKALFRTPRLTTVGVPRETLVPVFGKRSVLVVDGDEHKRHRKLLAPPFHGDKVEKHKATILASTDREIDRWSLGKAFALRSSMQAITLEVILDAVLGVRGGARRAILRDRIGGLIGLLNNPWSNFVAGLPTRIGPLNLRTPVLRRRAQLDRVLREEIAARRTDPDLEERADVLSLLIEARDENEVPLTDAEICDNLVTMLLAGHETAAITLAWGVDYVLRNPAACATLTEESRSPDGEMAFASATITETLRLVPPLPTVPRALAAPLAVGGYTLPPETIVAICTYLIQRRPDFYPPDPDDFRPDRFLEDPPDWAKWFPFGGGARRCLGANFAHFQAKVILARLFERCEMEVAEERPEAVRRSGLVLAPSRGTRIVLRSRRRAAAQVAA